MCLSLLPFGVQYLISYRLLKYDHLHIYYPPWCNLVAGNSFTVDLLFYKKNTVLNWGKFPLMYEFFRVQLIHLKQHRWGSPILFWWVPHHPLVSFFKLIFFFVANKRSLRFLNFIGVGFFCCFWLASYSLKKIMVIILVDLMQTF